LPARRIEIEERVLERRIGFLVGRYQWKAVLAILPSGGIHDGEVASRELRRIECIRWLIVDVRAALENRIAQRVLHLRSVRVDAGVGDRRGQVIADHDRSAGDQTAEVLLATLTDA